MEDANVVVYGNSFSQRNYDIYKSCKVVALPRKYGKAQLAYTIPKNSPFRSAFTYYTNQLKESGTINRLKQVYKVEDHTCPTYEGQPIGIRKCFFLFGMLSIGGGLSIILFL